MKMKRMESVKHKFVPFIFVTSVAFTIIPCCAAVPSFANCSQNNVWHFRGQYPSSPSISQQFRYPVSDAVIFMGQLASVSECKGVLNTFNSSRANGNASTHAFHSAENALRHEFVEDFGGIRAILNVIYVINTTFIVLFLCLAARLIWTWYRWRTIFCPGSRQNIDGKSLRPVSDNDAEVCGVASATDGQYCPGIRYGDSPILRQTLWICGLSDNAELEGILRTREEPIIVACYVTVSMLSNCFELIQDRVMLSKLTGEKFTCLAQMVVSAEFVRSYCEGQCGILGGTFSVGMSQDADELSLANCPWSYLPVNQQCAKLTDSPISKALPWFGNSPIAAQQVLCEANSFSVITWLLVCSAFLFLCNGPAALMQLYFMIRKRSLVSLTGVLKADQKIHLRKVGQFGALLGLLMSIVMVIIMMVELVKPSIRLFFNQGALQQLREFIFMTGYAFEMWLYAISILATFTCINMMLSACIMRVKNLRRMAALATECPDIETIKSFQRKWLSTFNDVNKYVGYTAPFILYFTLSILCFVLAMMAFLIPLSSGHGAGSSVSTGFSSNDAIAVLFIAGLPNSMVFAALLIQGSRLHAAGQSIHELLLAKLDDASSFEHSSSHWSSAVALTSWLSYRIPCMKIAGLRITWQTSARLVYLLGGAIVFVIVQSNNGWSRFN